MKFRWAVCALVVLAAGCTAQNSGDKSGSLLSQAQLHSTKGAKLPVAIREASQSIGNAPDRGALMSYKKQEGKPRQTGAYTWYPVAISEAHALRAVVTGDLVVPSPDGSQVKLKYERHEEQADGNWTWIGRVVGGDQKQEAILTFGKDAIYGSIPQPSGAPLSLQTRAGVLYAIQTDLSKVKSPNVSSMDMMVPPAMALRRALVRSTQKAQVASASAVMGKASSPSTTVDVAIGYTQGFATAQGGQSAAVTRLVFLIAVGNQAFENSLITGALRLVNAVQVTYGDNTSNQSALEDLTGVRNGAPITVPATLAPLRTARDQYGADLAVLVRKFQSPENDGCGIAWLNGAGQIAINPTVDDDFGFAVISDGNDLGTDGNSYFCAPETLVHEIGHLMGSAHDRDNSKTSTGALLYGRFPYSFGMKTTAANGNFYTIMAYGDNNQNFYRTFSNPLVLKCGVAGTLACGVTDQTDNARSLNQTIPVVATFRATVVPFPVVASPPAKILEDFNGDGRADILWKNADRLALWQMSGASVSALKVFEGSDSYTLSNSGDTSGDKRMELVWTKPASPVYIWLAIGNSFVGQRVADYPTGWDLAAVVDMDGDGNDDLVWQQTGRIAYWRMNGERILEVRSFDVPSTYELIGIGDISGDRRADFVWKTSATAFVYWVASGPAIFTISASQTFPADWTLAAVTDIDGDGKKDLVWQTSGRMAYWIMNGASTTRTRVENMDDSAVIVAAGDLNADGYSDLVWLRNSTDLIYWLGNGTTFTQTVNGVAPAGWEMVK